jgi:hypothetical protein
MQVCTGGIGYGDTQDPPDAGVCGHFDRRLGVSG